MSTMAVLIAVDKKERKKKREEKKRNSFARDDAGESEGNQNYLLSVRKG